MKSKAGDLGRRPRLAILGFCLVAIACLCGAGPAAAQEFRPHVAAGSFEGLPAGEIRDVATDDHSGAVYVVGNYLGSLTVFRYDAHGNPLPFSDPGLGGSNRLTVWSGETGVEQIAVDNSSGPTQGRIYVVNKAAASNAKTFAFEASGKAVGGKYPIEAAGTLIAVDPTTGDYWQNSVSLVGHINKFLPDGTETAQSVVVTKEGEPGDNYGLDIGPEGNLYVFAYPAVYKITPAGKILGQTHLETFGNLATNQVNGNVVFNAYKGYEFDSNFNELPAFESELNYTAQTGIAQNGGNGFLYVEKAGSEVFIFEPGPAVTLPDVTVGTVSAIAPTSLQVNGTVNPDGVETTKCVVEFGTTLAYGETAPCEPGQNLTGNAPVAVSAQLTGLSQGAIYHYRFVLENVEVAPNNKLVSHDNTARPSAPPTAGVPYIDSVHADGVTFHDEITPEGAPTTFHVLYGTADCVTEPGACTASAESSSVGVALKPVPASQQVTGLQPGTTYHYLFVVTNQSGTSESPEQIFTTFPFNPGFEDNCANAHVRQQVGAALLPDCRAYELASASNQNGYDVESYLVGGEAPFGGYPDAGGKVLYGIHDGALPGTGSPTNHGLDPYVATRGANGWTTKYVGIPATDPYSDEAFGSPLLAADGGLNTFAFGGEGLCSPCFGDGSTGVPVTLPDGSLVQGMTGSASPGPSAEPNLLAKKPLSADGRHLLFGSTAEFEAGAGSPAIYDRDFATGATHAVSKLPGGGAIPCLMQCGTDGLAELDVSADGSHVVIGQLLAVDSAGNHYWHLYMNVGDSSASIDLTPGATDGALYDGMTGNGSTVYFTTVDHLGGGDTDGSADIYRADVSGSSATLTLVSVGGGNGNTDNCEPSGNSVDEFWNSAEGEENCGVVAVSGGGGVAANSGSVFFLSPELLAGTAEPEDGVAGAPNFYEATPGSAPKYVSTLDSTLTAPTPPVTEHRQVGSFAHTPNPKYVGVDNSGGPSDGDVYVVDGSEEKVRKYTAAGTLITSWGTNGILNYNFGFEITGVAVGPTGNLFVAVFENSSGTDLFEFDENGALVATHNPEYTFFPVGIAIDGQGRVYYKGYYEKIMRWNPANGETTPISTWEYESGSKSGVAVDPITGELFVNFGGEEIGRFRFDNKERVIEASGAPCAHDCEPTEKFGGEEVTGAKEMFVDPTTEELYVDEGNKILRFSKNGTLAAGPSIGASVLTNSNSVAASNAGDVYATSNGSGGGSVEHFGPPVLAPEPQIDNPIVVHGVNDSGTRYAGDFQVAPSGQDAVFPTAIPYSGFNNNGFEELFLYHGAGPIECISCNPTGSRAIGSAQLAPDGLSLLEDGRAFFDSDEALVPRDLDNRQDVYEWENGKADLITTGISPYDSDLLSATADGKDVFFFTRDSLTPQDNNGRLVKVYDARENGGFPYVPPEASCKASDECHGAASQPGPAPGINTITGTRGNANEGSKALVCKKGYVKQKGKCVKKKHQKKKAKKGKKHHKRAKRSAADQGGAKR